VQNHPGINSEETQFCTTHVRAIITVGLEYPKKENSFCKYLRCTAVNILLSTLPNEEPTQKLLHITEDITKFYLTFQWLELTQQGV